MTSGRTTGPSADAEVSRDRSSVAGTVYRVRMVAICVVLVGLAFVQDAGFIVTDSKLDLTADPAGLLGRAQHLWDPQGFFGQLQNQAYGYFFPSGPFFLVGEALGVPDWAAQRAWWAVVMCVAFVGLVALAEALDIGTAGTRLFAGVAFALSPRVVSLLGAASVEVWPLAMAPWVLLPLVSVTRLGGSPRRAAALSGLALFAVGGVNAAATAATLVLPALWLATRQPGRERRRLAVMWAMASTAASLWWSVPLVLLGAYSPPFLDWIEEAATTTAHTSAAESLAGVSHWLAYLAGSAGPVWPAGFALVTSAVAVLNLMVLAAAGVAGLSHPGIRERRFLVLAVLAGLVLVGFGYTGALSGLAAEARQDWLDTALAPLRNTHKFDLVIRVPLALGLAHALTSLRLPGLSNDRSRALVTSVAGAALLATSGSSLVVGLAPPGAYQQIPAYWQRAADWLAENATGRTHVVPAASFAQHTWGTTRDEPLQALGSTPWGVRDAVPLSSAGNIRMLDAVERLLDVGEPAAGLAPYLARLGISHVIVRNDLDWVATGAPLPLLARSALSGSPGLRLAGSFGPLVGGERESQSRTVRGRLDFPVPAVQVWEVVASSEPRARRVPTSQTEVLVGAPEALLTLESLGIAPSVALLAGDDTIDSELEREMSSGGLLTDSLRLREVDYGSVRDNYSSTLTRADPLILDRIARDYLVPGTEGLESVAQLEGVASVTASSSGSDVRSLGARGPEFQPWSALDGDLRTAWVSGDVAPAVGQWWQVEFERALSLEQVSVALQVDPRLGPPVRTVLIETDGGTRVVEVKAEAGLQPVAVPPGETRSLRLTVDSVTDGDGALVGIAEVDIPNVTTSRVVAVPSPDLLRPPTQVVLSVAPGYAPECIVPSGRPVCGADLGAVGEEQGRLDRVVDLPAGAPYTLALQVRPRYGAALEQLLEIDDGRMSASGSSRSLASPLGRPAAAVDRDLATGWVAADGDGEPQLSLSWGTPRLVRGVQILLDPYLPASAPERVVVRAGGRTFVRTVNEQGFVFFPAVRTQRVTLELTDVRPLVSVDPRSLQEAVLPPGVSEVVVLGADDLRRTFPESAATGLPCGFGPEVLIGGRRIETAVRTTLGALVAGLPARAVACSPVSEEALGPATRISVASSGEFDPLSVVLTPAGMATTVNDRPGEIAIQSWEPTRRVVDLGESTTSTWVVLHENYNPGWLATLDGLALPTARVDGWAQAVLVPAGGGTLQLVFSPDRWYRLGLATGVLGIVALAVAGAWRGGGAMPGVGERRSSTRAMLAVVSVGMGLLAGLAGLLALSGALVAARVWGRGRVAMLPPLLVLAAGMVWASDPWPPPFQATGLVVQALVVTGVAALCVLTVAVDRDADAEPTVDRPDLGPGSSNGARVTPAGTS